MIKSIIIVGGGVIGVESAIRAAECGIKVTIIEKFPSLMSRNISQSASSFLENILRQKGVNILASSSADKILCGEKAVLETGDKFIETDLILLCIGCRPNTEYILSSGLEVNHGVRVNQKLYTSFNSVLSAGDAANMISGQHDFSVINAISQGKLAAINITEKISAEFIAPLPSIDIKHGAFELHTAGYHTCFPHAEERVVIKNDTVLKSLFYLKGRLIGVQMIGASDELASFKKLIERPLP